MGLFDSDFLNYQSPMASPFGNMFSGEGGGFPMSPASGQFALSGLTTPTARRRATVGLGNVLQPQRNKWGGVIGHTLISGGGGIGGNLASAYSAMNVTQQRAAADREQALSGVNALEALLTSRLQSPNVISDELAARMKARGALPIQGQAQAQKRRLEESYARRGIRGGAMRSATGAVDEGVGGQLANLSTSVDIEQAMRNRSSLMELLGVGQGIQGLKANILGNTIAAVPGYDAGGRATGGARTSIYDRVSGRHYPGASTLRAGLYLRGRGVGAGL